MKTSLLKRVIIGMSLVLSPSLFAQDTNERVIEGDLNAPLKIEKFIDFNCHFCLRGSIAIDQIMKDYPGKIKLVLRNLPLPSFSHYKKSLLAAKAFLAIYLQDPAKANAFQKTILEQNEALSSEGKLLIDRVAEKLNVDIDQMNIDIKSEQVETMLRQDEKIAQAHKITGTPGFIVGSEVVVGAYPYAHFKEIVDRQLRDMNK